jgi:hypothetical protein
VLELFALMALAAQQPPASPPPPPPPAVKVGEQAPDFTLPYIETEDGKIARKEVTLSSFRGKRNVVVAWFPAAFSPG